MIEICITYCAIKFAIADKTKQLLRNYETYNFLQTIV